MPKRPYRHRPLDYFFTKITMYKKIIDARPQCEECEHMNFIGFSPDYYIDYTEPGYCIACPNYSKVSIARAYAWMDDDLNIKGGYDAHDA